MRSASTRPCGDQPIIPIVAESLYRSLEYSIKRLIAMRSRATFSEMTNVILQLKNRKALGDFKIQPQKLNRKRVSRALDCLLRERKVVRKRRYFESPVALSVKRTELAQLKAAAVLLVMSAETES